MADKITVAGGVGESKIFAAPDAAKQAELDRLLKCHMGGVLVSDLVDQGKIDATLLGSVLNYWSTDEGREEANAAKLAPTPGVEVTRNAPGRRGSSLDPDKAVEQRRDAVRDVDGHAIEPWEAPDVRRDVAEKHTPEGHRARFLSPAVVDKLGTRGWQPVRDANGDPVRVGNMILASMPENKAQGRNRHYQERSRSALVAAHQSFEEQQHKVLRASGTSPSVLSRRAADGDIGLQRIPGNSTNVEQFLE